MSNFAQEVEAVLGIAKSKPSPAAQNVIDTGEAFAKAVEAWVPELTTDGINLLIDATPIIPSLLKPEIKSAIDFAITQGFKFGESVLDPLIAKALPQPTVTVTTTQTVASAPLPQ